MSRIEKKIADLVLRRIRKARSQEDGSANVPDSGAKSPRVVSLREAQLSDFERVCALNTKLGLGRDSPENWKRLWSENPSFGAGERAVIGWVLEASNDIVGFLASIRTLYEYEGKSLVAVTACRLAVEPGYRSFTHLLVTSFFRQENVDLFLNTTATVSAGKITMAFKAAPLPQKDYGNVLFWVMDPGNFAKSVLARIGLKSSLNKVGCILASLAVRIDILLRGRQPRAKSGRYKIVETTVNEIGDEFERFWLDKSHETSRLWAKRGATIMRWHFDPPGSSRVARVVGCYSDNRLVGYGVVRHDGQANPGLRCSVIADLLIEKDDPQIADQLLAAIYQSARNFGSHVLEAMGFPNEIRQTFLQWNPYSRNYPACPFFYKARDRELHEKLSNENAWYACPFDGDGTLWP